MFIMKRKGIRVTCQKGKGMACICMCFLPIKISQKRNIKTSSRETVIIDKRWNFIDRTLLPLTLDQYDAEPRV